MPALANAVAMARPIPLVDPVTSAALRSLICFPSVAQLARAHGNR
jgi:hypothetical protein